ncbi:MAG: hypothetical protein ACI84C_002214 [Flavobacteriales bacterium]|jgi:hypothetical protein
MKNLFIAALMLFSVVGMSQEKYTLSGAVMDSSTGEELIGATIYDAASASGTNTNVYGFFSLSLPAGQYDITISYIGYNNFVQEIDLTKDVKLDFELIPSSIEIGTAVIEGTNDAVENVEGVEMSKVKMSMDAIKKIPAFMGEVDVIKAIQMLPGVQTVGEGNSGFYVRGGAVDQNLILLDESAVYNASHLLGFFSVFNPDAIKDVQLYKGGIPARYGGRLSSVLDIRMREGNNKTYCAEGGLGTVSSRLTLTGPIVKDKGAFLISGRRTYADVFLKLSKEPGIKDTKLYFYDLNAKANYKLGENDRLFLSGYFGRDVSGFNDLFRIEWGNATGTARWNHIFGNKLFSNLTFVYSKFDYVLAQENDDIGFRWDSDIEDISLKYDFTYYLNPNNTLEFGIMGTKRQVDPGFARSTGETVVFNALKIPESNALETGIYVSNEQSITDALTAVYGVRFSTFSNMGAGTQWNYDTDFNPTDSVNYESWDIYNTFTNWEPRVGLNLRVGKGKSVKASYNRTAQYIQLASNSTASSPLDIWFPASPNVKPQQADQVAVGYFQNFFENTLEGSLEFYYKKMNNAIDFKNHAELLLNKHIEGELRFGDARSYGMEFMLRKQEGRLTGLVSYTLARTERRIPDVQEAWYPTKYDKTHDISALLSFAITDRLTVGANWVYSTGAAVTMPTGRFEYMGELVPVYSERNAQRMPAYHRGDISISWTSKKSATRKWEGEWVLSVYNVYYRKNPYSINFIQDENDPNKAYAEMTYLLPILPAITYNFKICK